MIRLTPILLAAALAGCVAPPSPEGTPPFPGTPAPPPAVPAQVAPFLPPGAPPSVLIKDNAGCYLYSIEVTDPPSGYPVRDAAGRQICDGQPVTMMAPIAPMAQPPAPGATTLAPTAPLLPPANAAVSGPVVSSVTGTVTGGTTIDGTPISQIPAPAPLPAPLPTPVE